MAVKKDSPKSLQETGKFKLQLPLDASGIEGFKPEQAVKVTAKDSKGEFYSQTVKLNRNGKGTAVFSFAKNPGALEVYAGPENASDEELSGLQTLKTKVSARQWVVNNDLKLPALRITPYYWYWWLRWCRIFTIRGVVRCPDGSPVPGATVCAYDVDRFWWWSSTQTVGCTTTDASGAFEIKFRWCCGWWPWFWWRRRFWRLEPDLIKRIEPIIRLDPAFPKILRKTDKPDVQYFEKLLSDDGEPPRIHKAKVDPSVLPGLRKRLLHKLPVIPEFETLKIWPWWPWYPWWDCTPDIIFHVTQNCENQDQVIVDENIWDTRWNIPTLLNVTLVANQNACCVGDPEIPEGECLLLATACDDLLSNIGGNPPPTVGSSTATDGFKYPGGGGTWSDRPYAGVVAIHGEFGDGANEDYYEFQWSDDDGLSWNDMPPDAAGSFARHYYGPQLGTVDPPAWHKVNFNFNEMEDTIGNKHYVVESRQHFEDNNEPGTWGLGSTHQWIWTTVSLLMRWKTAGIFSDGRYRLRVKSWKLNAPGTKLLSWQILPLCGTTDPNGMVLYLDNRIVSGGPVNPNGQPCGGSSIHLCTDEPDTDIVSVKIVHADSSKTDVAACGNVPINNTDMLEIDFVAHDPDGHLGLFSLDVHWGEDSWKPILPLGTLSTTGVTAPFWAIVANYTGPNYANAQSQGATPPIWHGGAMRFTAKAIDIFPETCCYLLKLVARKRTIASCDDDTWTHINRSERSFMIQV